MFLEINSVDFNLLLPLGRQEGEALPSSASVTEHQGQLEVLREHGKHDAE